MSGKTVTAQARPDPMPVAGQRPGPPFFTILIVAGGCGIRTREGLHPTRFPSLPSAVRRCSDQTAGRPLQASQPIVNPDERTRMRLKLRLALRLNWRDGGPRKIVITPCLQSDGMAVVQCC